MNNAPWVFFWNSHNKTQRKQPHNCFRNDFFTFLQYCEFLIIVKFIFWNRTHFKNSQKHCAFFWSYFRWWVTTHHISHFGLLWVEPQIKSKLKWQFSNPYPSNLMTRTSLFQKSKVLVIKLLGLRVDKLSLYTYPKSFLKLLPFPPPLHYRQKKIWLTPPPTPYTVHIKFFNDTHTPPPTTPIPYPAIPNYFIN